MRFLDSDSKLYLIRTSLRMELRSVHLPPLLPAVALMMMLVIPWGVTGYQTYSMERDCIRTGNISISLTARSAALLRATERSSYSLAMECRIQLSAPINYGIVVSVREIGFRVDSFGACRDYLLVKTEGNRPMCAHLFRLEEEHHFFSSGNVLEMLYHVSQEGMNNSTLSGYPGFQVTATAFTMKGGKDCPSEDGDSWFHCKKGHCIWKELKCDSHNNCGDLSDEQDCAGDLGGGGNSLVLIILGVLILLLLFIMCIATLLCSKNEQVRRLSNRIRSRTMTYWSRHSR